MMKVLGIIGSRRKTGNTAALVNAALEASEKEGMQVRAVYLDDYKIGGCRGCEGCRETYECVLRDGMQELYPLILEADAVVLGSPTHFYNVSCSISAFFERCYSFEIFDDADRSVWTSVNEALGGRYAVVIAVCEQDNESDMGFTPEAMRLPLEALGYRVVATVKALNLYHKGAAEKDEKAILQAKAAGKKLAKTLRLRKEAERRLRKRIADGQLYPGGAACD